jgi:hypothetical protein
MATNNDIVIRVNGNSTLARAKFGPGMLLQHDDLEQLNVYTRDLSRLMFRSLFGCGVVCGLVVEAKWDCDVITVTVNSGLALDCQGDPIHLPKAEEVKIDTKCHPEVKDELWIVLCGTQKCCAPRASVCGSDDDEDGPSACTRERDGYEIRVLLGKPGCVCGCLEPQAKPLADECKCVNPEDPCYKAHYAGICGCGCKDCGRCDCDCILLAHLTQEQEDKGKERSSWKADHRVRRFVRPMLMRDPQVEAERDSKNSGDGGKKPGAVKENPAHQTGGKKAV